MLRLAASFAVICAFTTIAHAESSGDTDMPRKMALAREYDALTHRQQISEDTVRRQLKLAWDGCETDPCRDKLDQVVATSVAKAIPRSTDAEITLLAGRLTIRELEAAITFARSTEGQSILAKENAMTEDFAQIGHDFARSINDDLLKDFCPAEPEACAKIAARQYAVMKSGK